MITFRHQLPQARRIVVKIGSALLASSSSSFQSVAHDINMLCERGIEVVLVSSGAIALGFPALGLSQRPRTLSLLQACAAIGQTQLMNTWAHALKAHQKHVAQLLLTHDDFKDRRRYINARAAVEELLAAHVIPIVNENDTVAVDEIKLGDNDTLAGAMGGLISADVVVLLTQTNGFYDSNPDTHIHAQRISRVEDVTEELLAKAGGASHLGTGGMFTKLHAARLAQTQGIATLILSGKQSGALIQAFSGEDIGTLVIATSQHSSARKRWLATGLKARGQLTVDLGAATALRSYASLLLPGIVRIQGHFDIDDLVDIFDTTGILIGRGLTQMTSEQLNRFAGMHTDKAQQLDSLVPQEVIHRDDFVRA